MTFLLGSFTLYLHFTIFTATGEKKINHTHFSLLLFAGPCLKSNNKKKALKHSIKLKDTEQEKNNRKKGLVVISEFNYLRLLLVSVHINHGM